MNNMNNNTNDKMSSKMSNNKVSNNTDKVNRFWKLFNDVDTYKLSWHKDLFMAVKFERELNTAALVRSAFYENAIPSFYLADGSVSATKRVGGYTRSARKAMGRSGSGSHTVEITLSDTDRKIIKLMESNDTNMSELFEIMALSNSIIFDDTISVVDRFEVYAVLSIKTVMDDMLRKFNGDVDFHQVFSDIIEITETIEMVKESPRWVTKNHSDATMVGGMLGYREGSFASYSEGLDVINAVKHFQNMIGETAKKEAEEKAIKEKQELLVAKKQFRTLLENMSLSNKELKAMKKDLSKLPSIVKPAIAIIGNDNAKSVIYQIIGNRLTAIAEGDC